MYLPLVLILGSSVNEATNKLQQEINWIYNWSNNGKTIDKINFVSNLETEL